MIDALHDFGLHLFAGQWWAHAAWPIIWTLLKIIAIIAPLMIAVAYTTLWERKLLGWMQARHGPDRKSTRLTPVTSLTRMPSSA